MKYLIEQSYHHNNPEPSITFTVDAKTKELAIAKAFLIAMSNKWGDEYEDFRTQFPVTLPDILKAVNDGGYHVLPYIDDQMGAGEPWYLHCWNEYERHSKSWNRGFGIGGQAPDSTDKLDNVWITLVKRGHATTSGQLISSIRGLMGKIHRANTSDLGKIYRLLTKAVK
jgi:hypothetical protein